MLRNENRKSGSNSTAKRLAACVLGLLAFLSLPVFGQNIHQLEYNNSGWVDTNLTSLAGAPAPITSGISAFYTSPDNDLHVFYADQAEQHIHQLTYKFYVIPGIWLWEDEDVSSESGGASATYYEPISAFSTNGAQYVYFCDGNGDVHEYAYGNEGNYS